MASMETFNFCENRGLSLLLLHVFWVVVPTDTVTFEKTWVILLFVQHYTEQPTGKTYWMFNDSKLIPN